MWFKGKNADTPVPSDVAAVNDAAAAASEVAATADAAATTAPAEAAPAEAPKKKKGGFLSWTFKTAMLGLTSPVWAPWYLVWKARNPLWGNRGWTAGIINSLVVPTVVLAAQGYGLTYLTLVAGENMKPKLGGTFGVYLGSYSDSYRDGIVTNFGDKGNGTLEGEMTVAKMNESFMFSVRSPVGDIPEQIRVRGKKDLRIHYSQSMWPKEWFNQLPFNLFQQTDYDVKRVEIINDDGTLMPLDPGTPTIGKTASTVYSGAAYLATQFQGVVNYFSGAQKTNSVPQKNPVVVPAAAPVATPVPAPQQP